MDMKEIENLLNTLMRGIDKKTALTVELGQESAAGRVTVRLTRDKRVGSLMISEDDLVASRNDLARRNRIRTNLKRARDRMWEQTTYIFSTKVEHQKQEGSGHFFFRPQSRGRR